MFHESRCKTADRAELLSCRLELNEFPLKNLNCSSEGGGDDEAIAIAASFSSFIIIHASLPLPLPTYLSKQSHTSLQRTYDAAVPSSGPNLNRPRFSRVAVAQ